MGRFILQRLVIAIPTLVVVTFLIFMIVRLIPGDPAKILAGDWATPEVVAQLRADWGLDKPLLVQYWIYLQNLARGNLGRSIATRDTVVHELAQRYPTTLSLAGLGILVAMVLGFTAGITAARKPFTGWDYGGMAVALLGISTPIFWSGLVLLLIFSVKLGVLPAGGTGSFKHLILPAISLGLFDAGVIARQTRANLFDAMQQDYVRTARAKGLAEGSVVNKHALKNAMIPVVTIIGMEFGRMLGGAVLTESVFSLPGLGRLLITAVSQRDYPIIQGVCLSLAVTFVFINLLVDLTYGFLDPRIRQ
jgi:peptide/nickel transport system permease protein